jgi:hypothetical protein
MPCYLRYIQPVGASLVDEIKRRAKAQGKVQPTKVITRGVLKEALKAGTISAAKYSQLIALVDACVEERGHVHEHEHEEVRA